MRNLLQYPLNLDDTKIAVESSIKHLNDLQHFGDIRGLALQTLAQFLEINGDMYINFLLIEHGKFVEALNRKQTNSSV